MIRVVITVDLEDWWGADEAYSEGGPKLVRELCEEDMPAVLEHAQWNIQPLGLPKEGR